MKRVGVPNVVAARGRRRDFRRRREALQHRSLLAVELSRRCREVVRERWVVPDGLDRRPPVPVQDRRRLGPERVRVRRPTTRRERATTTTWRAIHNHVKRSDGPPRPDGPRRPLTGTRPATALHGTSHCHWSWCVSLHASPCFGFCCAQDYRL